MIRCPLCAKMFQNQRALHHHMFSHTKEKPHKCLICSATFGWAENLKKHIKSVHDGVKVIKKKNSHCPSCSYKCEDKYQLKIHMRKHSTDQPFSCNILGCGFKTKYNLSLSEHVKGYHSDERPYKCQSDGCNYKAKTPKCLKQHLNIHSKEKPFACTVAGCNYTCKVKGHLRLHTIRAHSTEKPFKCSTCDFRAKIKGALVLHQHKHTTDQRFQCPASNCSYRNVDRSQLAKHVDRKHRKKDVRCTAPGCNFRCGSIKLLKLHLKEHDKPRLKCPGDSCRYSTTLKNNLVKHISRFHNDIQSATVMGPRLSDLETLYCSFPNCDFQTKFPHFYDRHIKTHNEEERRNHICSFCFSRFRYLCELKAHVQRHVKEKPYSCSLCKYTAGSGFGLVGHAKRTHHVRVTPRGKEDEVKNCRTCARTCLGYGELVLHSMIHLKPVVVLERLRVQVM